MNEPREDDLPHDAWLREALRHAPDAEAGPPPKLNETILRMGRAAVAPRAERKASTAAPMPAPSLGGLAETISSWWSWLARPPVAAGFAGLMVATVVGVMWWDRPLEEALPPREETVAAAPPSEVTAPAVATAPAPAGLPEAAKQAAAATAADAPARKAAAPAPVAAPKLEAPPPAAPAPTAAPPAAPAPTVMAESAARERESAERREAASARMAATTPPPATADAAAPSALIGRAATAAAAPAAPASAIETPSLSNLRFEIRRSPDQWTWQRDDGESRPMDDAMQDWIAQADRTARPSWQHGASGADSSTTTLRFTRGGVVRAVLRLGPNGMRLTRGGKTESVELSRGAVASLQSSLDALGP
ncbi:hypothetical protein [Variovorax sp. YR752]|uniref:hypothetical protein n=1 Tax=Variovorax sp. YR752 TaxID=1884383 RepID=UPI003138197E